MARQGKFHRLVFRSLDKRGKPAAPDNTLKECLNLIIGRDGVVRRRLGVSPIKKAFDLFPGANILPAIEGATELSFAGEFPYRYLDESFDFITVAVRGQNSARIGAVGINEYGAIFTFDAPGWLRMDRSPSPDLPQAGVTARSPFQWPYYQSERIDASVFDSSIPGSSSNYRELLLANGASIMQSIRTNANSDETTPVELKGQPDQGTGNPVHVDPQILEHISRAEFAVQHKGIMYYKSPKFGNVLFYSVATDGLGAPHFYEFDTSNHYLKIASGSDSPIRRAVSFGDSLMIFTRKSVWRFTGDPFGGVAARLVKVFDVGCPSRNGVEYISSFGGGVETRDATGRMIFVTNEKEIVITDGVSTQTVSEPVRPLLEKLHEEQIKNMWIRTYGDNGYVVILWPSPHPNMTQGLVYDYFEDRWAGELEYMFPINFLKNGVVRGKDALLVHAVGALSITFFNLLSVTISAESDTNVTGVLFGEDTGLDLYWRGTSSLDRTNPLNDYDFAGDGRQFRTRLLTQTFEMDAASTSKKVANVDFEFEPLGDWDVDLELYPDGTRKPDVHPANMLGGTDLPYGVKPDTDFRFDISPGKPREAFTVEHGGKCNSGYFAVGINHEPSATGRVETIKSHDGQGGGVSADVLCAEPGGFALRAIELNIKAGKHFHGPTHLSDAS